MRCTASGCRCKAALAKATGCRAFSAFDGIETGLWILDLSRFLDANRSPPPDQVRGHASRENALVLLRHKFIRTRRAVEARQHGHRGKRLTRASMMRRRTVAIEFGT